MNFFKGAHCQRLCCEILLGLNFGNSLIVYATRRSNNCQSGSLAASLN